MKNHLVPTVIINDVQEYCLPNREDLAGYAPLAAILRETRNAVHAGANIVVVLYDVMGALNGELAQILQGYDRVEFVTKSEWNGAVRIVEACRRRGFAMSAFRLFGFYTHKCVQSTARGLNVQIPDCKVEVVRDACDDDGGNYWSRFPRLPGLSLRPPLAA